MTVTGCVKKIDEYESMVCLTDGMKITIEKIIAIEGELIEAYIYCDLCDKKWFI